ncbi:hypothetical protein AJ78_04996 [Emergomyces pasteurianus Ep9510]|uniref:ORP1 n=1 Tax=Emergomyces pasteurianus Ep9510 TaxID=1447872 RepID=A0A1J9PDT3_9EURO|nr:hypothetical protein AJ78_04996 [Emergomyces pasteurianus Ep9510]
MPVSLSEPLGVQTLCQFSGEACSTESHHYRKVISHIFGRNKKCTVGIPEYVWIYYCRKHYQRARYRTAEWPFRQCDLAIDTLRNMRSWGGVESFNLQLRRRETWRTTRRAEDNDNYGKNDIAHQNEDILHIKTENHESRRPFQSTGIGTFTPINKGIHTNPPLKVGPSDYEGDEEGSENNSVLANHPAKTSLKRKMASRKKRSPTIIPHPVPEWLHTRVGSNKTFDDILSVLGDLRTHLTQITNQKQTPHFPDIEILPNLRPHAAAASRRTRRRAARPTLQPLPPSINVPAPNNKFDPMISASTQILTRRRAVSLDDLRRAEGSFETTTNHTPPRTHSLAGTDCRVAEPSTRSSTDRESVDSSDKANESDSGNMSINFPIRRTAHLPNPTMSTSRVSGRDAVKKMTKNKKNKHLK